MWKDLPKSYPFARPQAALFASDHPDTPEGGAGRLPEALRDVLRAAGADRCVVIPLAGGRAGLILPAAWSRSVESWRRNIASVLGAPVTAGVGTPADRHASLERSCQQAELAMRHRFYAGAGRTIRFDGIRPYAELPGYPAEQERELFAHVRAAGPGDDFAPAVRAFYRGLLRRGPIDVDAVKELSIRLLARAEDRLYEEGGSPRMGGSLLDLMRLETLEEWQQAVAGYLCQLSERDSAAAAEGGSIVEATLHFMERECGQATLTSMAHKVYVSPAYLSMLFKIRTGQTFTEKLTDIRIEQAKRMLQATFLKNYEVAEKVGYHDSRYFSQIFKRKVGLTPSEYRERVSAYR